MLTFASNCPLTLAFFLLLAPAPCPAQECKIGTASAPLHAAVGGGQGCSHIFEVKVCAPAGKVIKSSSVRDLSASPTIEFDKELRNVDSGCVQAIVTVRAHSVIGPPIWQYCAEGSYEGRAELIYCR
jgi:hypothetical protein